MYANFLEWLNYETTILQSILDIIMSNWLTAVMFGLNIFYLVVIAIKLKKNTE